MSLLVSLSLALAAPPGVAADLPKNDRPAPVVPKNRPPPPPPPPPPQDYEPNPAIWTLADEDTTIHLFGTFHALPPGFRWRSAAFDAIVAGADELVVETSDEDAAGALEADFMAQAVARSLEQAPTSERLGGEAGRKWLTLGREAGMPAEVFDRMPPFFALMALGFDWSEAMGSDSDSGVETVLEAEFAAAGKPIGSIEDAEGVFAALLAIDDAPLIDDLRADLDAWDGEDADAFGTMFEEEFDDPWAMEHAWARGEAESLDIAGWDENAFDRTLRQVLLADRNRAWTRWLEDRLDRPGTLLVAVGAAHFAGEDSVLAMLAERGLAVVRRR